MQNTTLFSVFSFHFSIFRRNNFSKMLHFCTYTLHRNFFLKRYIGRGSDFQLLSVLIIQKTKKNSPWFPRILRLLFFFHNMCEYLIESRSFIFLYLFQFGRGGASSYIKGIRTRHRRVVIFRSVARRARKNSAFISRTAVIPARYQRGHKSESLFRMRDACPRGPTSGRCYSRRISLPENRRIQCVNFDSPCGRGNARRATWPLADVFLQKESYTILKSR